MNDYAMEKIMFAVHQCQISNKMSDIENLVSTIIRTTHEVTSNHDELLELEEMFFERAAASRAMENLDKSFRVGA